MVTLKKPRSPAGLRMLKNPIYDTEDIPAAAAATTTIMFFHNPIGQGTGVAGTVKTSSETNLRTSGQLGDPNKFELFGFQAEVYYDNIPKEVADTYAAVGDIFDDFAEIYEQGVFKFRNNQKNWLTVPLTRIPHGQYHLTGPRDSASDNAAALGINLVPVSNGVQSYNEYFKYRVDGRNMMIGSTETFRARIDYPNGAIGLTASGDETRITVYLCGILYSAM